MLDFSKYRTTLEEIDPLQYSGFITSISGLAVEASGPPSKIGDICEIHPRGGGVLRAEVVGVGNGNAILTPYGRLEGVGLSDRVEYKGLSLEVPVGRQMIGRVLDALAMPMDEGPPPVPEAYYPVEAAPPNPLARERIHDVMPLGVKAIDGLLTVGRGQRLGIFAGSGVGKSTLMGMIARSAVSDVNIIILVGERGREVRDFIEKDLGKEGLARSVLLIATSDMSALLRLKCALVGTAIAEYFRDQGKHVLLLMDSLTRFSMAQREIGMASGEPPVSRGYPPSVYAMMPKLLERSGTSDKGSITGLYTVLVEGDDMNEPIADTARGILDGHIVLSRSIANANRYPAIDVLQSVSRVMPDIVSKEHRAAAGKIRSILETYRGAEDMINIGAYKKGASAAIDAAIDSYPDVLNFLKQGVEEKFAFEDTISILTKIGS